MPAEDRSTRWTGLYLWVLTVSACQYGLHFSVLVTSPRASEGDGFVFLGLFIAAPVALCYGLLVSFLALHVSPDRWSVLVKQTAAYVALLAAAFFMTIAAVSDFDSALLCVAVVPVGSVFGIVALPLMLPLYAGYPASRFLAMAAVGGISISPILFLLWRARSHDGVGTFHVRSSQPS